jgi:hypothetical protein
MRRSELGMHIDVLLYFKRAQLSSKLAYADFRKAPSRAAAGVDLVRRRYIEAATRNFFVRDFRVSTASMAVASRLRSDGEAVGLVFRSRVEALQRNDPRFLATSGHESPARKASLVNRAQARIGRFTRQRYVHIIIDLRGNLSRMGSCAHVSGIRFPDYFEHIYADCR